MNPKHFSAIVRMRWQMMRNQFRKSGNANRIISMILLTLAALGSLGSFVFAVGWGNFFLAKMDPFYVIYVWDVLAGVFLFGWAIALMVELQRSEILSLRNLLYLPISLAGAFFLNYTSSLASLTVLLFLPAMLGLCLASVMHFGSNSLVTFPLLTSFLLMITAVSYQLRGWLARLMENKRTRGTVITVTTVVFIMIFQLPNLINLGTMSSRNAGSNTLRIARTNRLAELKGQLRNGEIEQAEFTAATKLARKEYRERRETLHAAKTAAFNQNASVLNAALPIGWLPYGASSAAQGAFLAPWLCVLGMSTIGIASLALSYRSTLRAYTGEHNKEYRPETRKRTHVVANDSMLEKSIPFLTDTQSVITMATLRSTLRAPEAKMALLTPLIVACVFGSMMLTGNVDKFPQFVRPWYGIGALGISLVAMLQLMLNIFGLDRQGFRAFVLMPAPRRDILLGKNLGIFPIAGVLSALLVVFMGIVGKMQFTNVAATVLQIVVVFFAYFTVSNYTSIVAPIGLAAGSMRPVSMKFSVVLMQVIAMLLVPVAILPAALALGTELLASVFGGIHNIPIYLLLTLIELPIAIWFYNRMLHVQGRFLQEREQAILDTVSKVAD